METQGKPVHVHKGSVGELAHGMLADAGKQRIAQLVEPDLYQPRQIIGDDKRDSTEQEGRNQPDHVQLAVQRIRCPFEEIGNEDQHQLGDNEKRRRPDHPHFQVKAAFRPHIGPEVDEGLRGIAGIRRNGFFLGGHHLLRALPEADSRAAALESRRACHR
ncbi:hypothetical protein D3C87_1555160 [compost metagenome]